MNTPGVEELRQKAMELQEQEVQLTLQAQSLQESSPKRTRMALKKFGSASSDDVLRQSDALHNRISELLGERDIGEIFNADCLRKIVACQEALVKLHSESLRKIREIFSQR